MSKETHIPMIGEAYSQWLPIFLQICWSTNMLEHRGNFLANMLEHRGRLGAGGGAPDLGFRPSAEWERGPETREQGGRATGPAPFRSFSARNPKLSGGNRKHSGEYWTGDLRPGNKEVKRGPRPNSWFPCFSIFVTPIDYIYLSDPKLLDPCLNLACTSMSAS